MLYNIFQSWNDPQNAVLLYVFWIIIVVIIGIKFKIFTKEFVRFGTAKKNEKPVKFMGREITTNKEIICIMIYSFLNQLISNYNSSIISPWKINTIQYPKTNLINMSKKKILVLLNLDNIFGWLNYIINLAMILTMEMQFIIPKIFASVIIDNISTLRYIADKQFI